MYVGYIAFVIRLLVWPKGGYYSFGCSVCFGRVGINMYQTAKCCSHLIGTSDTVALSLLNLTRHMCHFANKCTLYINECLVYVWINNTHEILCVCIYTYTQGAGKYK